MDALFLQFILNTSFVGSKMGVSEMSPRKRLLYSWRKMKLGSFIFSSSFLVVTVSATLLAAPVTE